LTTYRLSFSFLAFVIEVAETSYWVSKNKENYSDSKIKGDTTGTNLTPTDIEKPWRKKVADPCEYPKAPCCDKEPHHYFRSSYILSGHWYEGTVSGCYEG